MDRPCESLASRPENAGQIGPVLLAPVEPLTTPQEAAGPCHVEHAAYSDVLSARQFELFQLRQESQTTVPLPQRVHTLLGGITINREQ